MRELSFSNAHDVQKNVGWINNLNCIIGKMSLKCQGCDNDIDTKTEISYWYVALTAIEIDGKTAYATKYVDLCAKCGSVIQLAGRRISFPLKWSRSNCEETIHEMEKDGYCAHTGFKIS